VSAYSCRAWVAIVAGHGHGARELIEQARRLADEKGSSVMLARLGELDAELTQPSVTTAGPV